MKKFIIGLFSFLLIVSFLPILTPATSAEEFITGAFVTTWNTENPGVSASNEIKIQTNSNQIYDYNVDWGDGSSDTEQTGDAIHTYATPGIYTVSITGTYPQIYFDSYWIEESSDNKNTFC